MRTTTVARLRIGQRFSWIPAGWYGSGRLTYKKGYRNVNSGERVYDLKYDARVVNPPAINYDVPGNTRVRLLRGIRGSKKPVRAK